MYMDRIKTMVTKTKGFTNHDGRKTIVVENDKLSIDV